MKTFYLITIDFFLCLVILEYVKDFQLPSLNDDYEQGNVVIECNEEII